MPIVDGQPVNAAITNAAKMDRQQDTDTIGRVQTSKWFTALLSSVVSTATLNAMTSASGLVAITGSTATALNGIANQENGKIFTLYNAASANITVANNSGSASVGQKILTPDGNPIVILPGRSLDFKWETTLNSWIITGGTAIPSSIPTSNSASISNNTSGNVTGLVFSATTQFSASVPYNVLRGTAMETGLLTISYNGVTWTASKAWYVGDAGIDFGISSGQITYTSDNSSSGTMKFSYSTLGA